MVFVSSFAHELAPDHQRSSLERQSLAGIYPSPEPTHSALDGSTLQSAIMATDLENQPFRKDSVMNNSDHLSSYDPRNTQWNQKYDVHEFGGDHSLSFAPTNPFYTPDTIFNRTDSTNQTSTSLPQDQAWTYDQTNQKTSPSQFDADDFDVTEYAPLAMKHSYPSFTPIQQKQPSTHPAHVQTPISPHSHTEWASPAAQELQAHPLRKQMRRPSTHVRSLSECARPDGIRKKNTRIDIPPERSLVAIERLLEDSKNEDERKELKGQRRLLRNREAALASRQRKKKHTEDLEVKERNYMGQISDLETRYHEMHMRCSHAEQQMQFLVERHAEMHHMLDTVQAEKQDLIFMHTKETSLLRKQVEHLHNEIEHHPAPAMSAVPSSNGQNDFTSDFNALHVDSRGWDDFILTQEPRDLSHRTKDNSISHCQSTSNGQDAKSHHVDPPIATGVLFMLLLCGAFVASRPNSTSNVPRMPDEVRAASTTVLESLLKDSRADGISLGADQRPSQTQMNMEPQPSSAYGEYYSRPNAEEHRIDSLHRSLTTPSRAQEAEQLFSLTPSEYAAISGQDASTIFDDSTSLHTVPRHNLAEVLANFREESVSKGGAAEIYTRSLLWDQIPTEVVKQFKELVKDSQKAEGVDTKHNNLGFGFHKGGQKH